MKNVDKLAGLLNSYNRSFTEGEAVSGDRREELRLQVVDQYLSSFGESENTAIRKGQYLSFLREAESIDNGLPKLCGIGGAVLAGYGSSMAVSYLAGGVEGLVALLIGGTVGGIAGYKSGKHLIVTSPRDTLLRDYAARLDRLDDETKK
ncbi:MAG: hypothetical protein AABX05_02705 [Nanoarchaeota archaeon]